jgi:hypothetical protein
LATLGQSLFEKIFPKVLPFPFDNYKSSRTNAAQDCIDFTRKLLFQSFTFDDVKTMQVRQKNRITQVLQLSWKIFNKDGTVLSLAGLTSAKAIESEWDKSLYGNNELNCTAALTQACAAPYGANLSSAGLLFAVYIQARRNMLTVIRNGERVEFPTISDKLFDGTVLSIKELENITLFKTETESSEWESFLKEWENAISFADRVAFSEKADEIEARLRIPMQIRWKHQELKRLAAEAKRKIDDADCLESKALSKMEAGEAERDIWLLSFGAAKLSECVDLKRKDQMWAPDEIIAMLSRMDKAKQFIVQHFELWLRRQVPSERTVHAFTEFKARLVGQTGGNLKKLQLREQYEQLEKYVDAFSRNFEAVTASQQVINDFDTWLVSNSVLPRDTTYSQIQLLLRTIKQQEDALSTHKSQMRRLAQEALLAELEARSEKLLAFQKNIAKKNKEIQAKGDSIWKTELSTETAETLMGQVQDLERIYAGDESNIEDFRNMRSIIQMFLNYYRQLGSIQLPIDDFHVQKNAAREEFLKHFAEAEPPWDLEGTFDTMLAECEKTRSEASKNWIEGVATRATGLSKMTSQQADELLRTVSAPPVYFSGEAYEKKLTTLHKKIESHLESKGVEWLYEKFLQLSPVARKSFLALLKTK